MSWSHAIRRPPYVDESNAPGDRGATAIFEDREGNIWVGSSLGLTRRTERNVVPQIESARSDFSSIGAGMAPADDHALWVISRSGRALLLRDGSFTASETIGESSCTIRAKDGTNWFAGRGSVVKLASGRIDRIPLPKDAGAFEVQAMTQDDSGGLWVSVVRKGLYRWSHGDWTPYGGIDALPRLTAMTMTADARGRIVFGYTAGRIAILSNGRVSFLNDARQSPLGNVTALYGGRANLWAGGDLGLARVVGETLQMIVTDTGASVKGVTGIVETASGDLWVNASIGIVHFGAGEMTRQFHDTSYRPHAEVFDARDGLEGGAARLRPLPTAIEGTAGDALYFMTDAGLYSIQPSRIHRNTLPPPVFIESVAAGSTIYRPSPNLVLPEGTRSLQIGYAGLSLTNAEKVRFRYRLDGVDDGWQDAQGPRVANYTNLVPGRHRFFVTAANNDGVWNPTGAELEFFIPPTFTQTQWFVGLCVAATGLTIWLIVWFHVRHVTAHMRERFAVRTEERERIARELHDTLLQSTQGLIMRFQAVANRLAREDPCRELLDEALSRADAVMVEAREKVLDLRLPSHATSNLETAIGAIVQDLSRGSNVRASCRVQGAIRPVRPAVRDEVYCIAREALLNAFRHAQANSIDIHIAYCTREFGVSIHDDGIGLDWTARTPLAKAGHWGLQGMRERAGRVGARLDITSRPGGGTQVQIVVPAGLAYDPKWPLQRLSRMPVPGRTQPS